MQKNSSTSNKASIYLIVKTYVLNLDNSQYNDNNGYDNHDDGDDEREDYCFLNINCIFANHCYQLFQTRLYLTFIVNKKEFYLALV